MHIGLIQLSFAVKTWCIMLLAGCAVMGAGGTCYAGPAPGGIPMNDQTSTQRAEVGRSCSNGRFQPAAAKRPRLTFRKRLLDPLTLISRIMAA